MSIIAGGTNALMQLLARRKLEERQQMIDAITVADKQKQWADAATRNQQTTRQIDLQEKNQGLLREEQRLNRERLEKQDRTRVLTNIAQRAQPSEDIGEGLYREMEGEGLAGGFATRKPGVRAPGMETTLQAPTKEGDIPTLPVSIGREPFKITKDTFPSQGGSEYQMARQAAVEKAEQATAAEAARAKAQEDRQKHDLERDQERADNRAMIAALAAQSRQGLSGAQRVAAQNTLRRGFTTDTKEFGVLANAYRDLSVTLGQESAAGDLAAIFRFMKAQDPTSTVREGEQASAQNAAGVPDRIRNYWNHLVTGQRLSPAQRQDFLSVAQGLYQSGKVQYDQRVKEYTDDALSLDIDPARVIRDHTVTDTPAQKPATVSPAKLDDASIDALIQSTRGKK